MSHMRSNVNKTNARIQLQNEQMSTYYAKKDKEAEERATTGASRKLMEDAGRTFSGAEYNRKVRVASAQRAATYKNHFITEALTKVLAKIVEESLLVDTEQYGKLNENYSTEIKSTIKSLIENVEVSPKINNKQILAIYEQIIKNVPDANLYLSEAEEQKLIDTKILSDTTINREIEDLSSDIKARVADIVAKEQDRMAEENGAIQNASAAEAAAVVQQPADVAPVVPEEQPEQPEEAPVAEQQALLDPEKIKVFADTLPEDKKEQFLKLSPEEQAQIISHVVSNEQEQQPHEEEEFEAPKEEEKEEHASVSSSKQIAAFADTLPEKLKQVFLALPVDRQTDAIENMFGLLMGKACAEPEEAPVEEKPVEPVHESFKFVKKKKKKGILETLTMNEATSMLNEGKAYDSTLALANAITYITILETLDQTEIVPVGQETYNDIIVQSGNEVAPDMIVADSVKDSTYCEKPIDQMTCVHVDDVVSEKDVAPAVVLAPAEGTAKEVATMLTAKAEADAQKAEDAQAHAELSKELSDIAASAVPAEFA